jgi:hypothetical protein
MRAGEVTEIATSQAQYQLTIIIDAVLARTQPAVSIGVAQVNDDVGLIGIFIFHSLVPD